MRGRNKSRMKKKSIRKKRADELTDMEKFIIMQQLESMPKICEKAKQFRKKVLKERENKSN